MPLLSSRNVSLFTGPQGPAGPPGPPGPLGPSGPQGPPGSSSTSTGKLVAAMAAITGATAGQLTDLHGVNAAGDGGGGQFWFEVNPANRRITSVTTQTVPLSSTAQFNPGVDLRVLVTSTGAHGLVEGQALTISGSSDAGANGSWIITLVGVGSPTTQFILRGSVSQSNGSGGTARSTIIGFAANHPYQAGQRISVRNVTWAGGPGINGAYDGLGVVDVLHVSVPFLSAGSYVSGGMTGDDAIIVPAADGSGAWHRNIAPNEVHALWFGMPLDGTHDDRPAVSAAIASLAGGTLEGVHVHLPPTPPGINAPLFLTPLRVSRKCRLIGAGFEATIITVPTLQDGIIFEENQTSQDGGASQWSEYEYFTLRSAQTSFSLRQSSHAYVPGNIVAWPFADAGTPALPGPVCDPRYYYVCVAGGTTAGSAPAATTDAEYTFTDGGVTWVAKTAAGVRSKAEAWGWQVQVTGFSTAALHYQGSGAASPPAGPSFNDGGGCARFQISNCGAGIVTKGGDAQGAKFHDGGAVGIGANYPGTSGYGIINESQGGAYFDNVQVTNCGARGYYSAVNAGGPSNFTNCASESAHPDHLAGTAVVVGGSYGAGLTTNSLALLLAQSTHNSNLNMTGTSWGSASTTLSLCNIGTVDLAEFGSSDDSFLTFNWSYLFPSLPGAGLGYWALEYQSQFGVMAITNRLATYDGTHVVGPGLPWILRAELRGADQVCHFDDATNRDNFLVRNGLRKIGDRVRLAANVASGGPSEQIVLTAGYEFPAWAASTAINAPNFQLAFNQGIRPTTSAPLAQQGKRFSVQSVTGDTQTGATEPDWSTATVVGTSTVVDNHVTWLYVGNAPVYGANEGRVQDLTKIDLTGLTSPITLTAIQAQARRIRLTGTLTGAFAVVVKTPALLGAAPGANSREWIFDNETSGGFTVTAKATSGDAGVAVAPATALLAWSDGTNMKTAAPPAGTGIPPAPVQNAALTLAGASTPCGQNAGGSVDVTPPFNHLTFVASKAGAKIRVKVSLEVNTSAGNNMTLKITARATGGGNYGTVYQVVQTSSFGIVVMGDSVVFDGGAFALLPQNGSNSTDIGIEIDGDTTITTTAGHGSFWAEEVA